jgi:nicotinic acid mononucleotide adenylyltransferase
LRALVYGGAFNPPTIAHIELADFARKAAGFDKVIFVPSKMRYITDDQKKDFAFDDAVFLEGQLLHPFVYRKQWLTGYLERNKDSVHLAIIPKDAPVGEILFK